MFPHLSLTSDPHHRLGLQRTDDAWLEERWADPDSRVLVISGTRVRPGADGIEWVPSEAAPDGVRLLLGERDGATWWGVIVSGDLAKAEPDRWLPLRGLLGLLNSPSASSAQVGQQAAGDASRRAAGGDPASDGAQRSQAPLVFHALGLAEWHWAHRFCPRCGGALQPRAAGHELVCADCGKPQFPRSDPAVIMLVTAGEPGSSQERCLLGRGATWPAGRFSTLAGFCEPGETLEDAVRREVLEETGVVVGEVSYFGNQPWPLPSSLMLGFHARALSEEIRLEDAEVEEALWVTREEMRRGAEDGSLVLPGGVSISRSLIESWFGGPLPGSW